MSKDLLALIYDTIAETTTIMPAIPAVTKLAIALSGGTQPPFYILATFPDDNGAAEYRELGNYIKGLRCLNSSRAESNHDDINKEK